MRSFIAAFLIAAAPAGAYYHFTRYTGRGFPYNPVAAKFDIDALPNKTVTFFVGDVSIGQVTQPELAPSLLAHIRDAARAWNSVATSDLRVAFGGLATYGSQQATPGADIIFEEMNPLVLGYGAPTVVGSLATGLNGPFVPVVRSLIRLNRDLAVWRTPDNGPSFHEAFFLTVTHEMGHALGLQHSFTSSLMSTAPTRSTTLVRPLDPDDIAGISLLYPAPGFASGAGSVIGRVTYEGSNQGVHLASVVAIRANGAAISSLTDPDGRYRIEGIPPDVYQLYVHPLPPAPRADAAPGDIILPLDPDARPVAPGPGFDTVFFSGGSGTRDISRASYFTITPGVAYDGVNIAVSPRSAAALLSVTTYSYFGNTPVRPSFLNGATGAPLSMVVDGIGLASNNTPAAGLSVGFVGGAPQLAATGLRAYADKFLILDVLATSTFGVSGPRHLVFSLPNDLYVRPFGATFVSDRPPSITSVTAGFEPNGVRTLTIAGSDFRPETRFLFEGVRSGLLRFDDQGRAVVAVPPGLNNAKVTLTAFNPDGQNSMFLQSGAPAAFTYDGGEPGSLSLNPASAPAGGELVVEINGINTGFTEGLTTVGFGSSDVQVRRVWVLSPTRLWANLWVAPNAPSLQTLVSVVTGHQVISAPFAFQIDGSALAAATGGAPRISSAIVNTAPGQSALYPGAMVTMPGMNLAGAAVTVADHAAPVANSSATSLTFQIPQGLPAGPAILRVTTGGGSSALAISIALAPPEIRAVSLGGAPVDASRAPQAGDMVTLLVSGLVDSGAVPASRLVVKVGGIDHSVQDVTSSSGGGHILNFILSASVTPGPQVPVQIWMDGRLSAPVLMPIR